MSWKFGQAALVLGLLLFTSQAHAALTYVGKFTDSNGNELDVVTYFQPATADAKSAKVGVLGIQSSGRRISIAFDAENWPRLMALWNKARVAQSNSWREVGDYTETDTEDPSTLKLSAGPGATFLISSAARGIETYLLPAADLDRFDAAVKDVQTALANQDSE